mgnify:CR=1 FL=1
MTWVELVARYQEWLLHSSGRSEATVHKYGRHLLRLGEWYDQPPEDPKLRPAAESPMQATIDDLELFAGLYAHAQGMSPRSRAPIIAAMKSFYRWASKRAGLRNEAINLVYPEIGRRLPVPASMHTAEKLIMAPDTSTFLGLRDAAILTTLIGTGIRVSGLVGMNESSLLWAHEGGREWLDIKVKEKGCKERIVPAPIEAQIMIKAYLAHPELAGIDRLTKTGDLLLWVSTMNRCVTPDKYHGEARRMRPHAVNKVIIKYGKQAGLPREQCHPHAFRHLFGTQLAEHDIDPWQRMALMGHADIKSTQVYTHLAMRKLRETSDKANPLRGLKAPVLDSAREIYRRRGGSGQ